MEQIPRRSTYQQAPTPVVVYCKGRAASPRPVASPRQVLPACRPIPKVATNPFRHPGEWIPGASEPTPFKPRTKTWRRRTPEPRRDLKFLHPLPVLLSLKGLAGKSFPILGFSPPKAQEAPARHRPLPRPQPSHIQGLPGTNHQWGGIPLRMSIREICGRVRRPRLHPPMPIIPRLGWMAFVPCSLQISADGCRVIPSGA